MSTVSISEKAFILSDDSNKKTEVMSFVAHPFVGSENTDQVLRGIYQRSREVLSYSMDAEAVMHWIVDGVLASHLLNAEKSVKVVELGCENGKLSFHLAQLLGKIDPDSLLCLVVQEISNDYRIACLDTIAAAECSPEVSLVVSEYHDTHLADHYFDAVVINGSINFDDPAAVILEAERMVKLGGAIVCVCDNAHLLVSTFKLFFPEYREYMLTHNQIVLEATLDHSTVFYQRMQGVV